MTALPDPVTGIPLPGCVQVAGSRAAVRLPFTVVPAERQQDWDEAATALLAQGGPDPFGPPVTATGPIAPFAIPGRHWAEGPPLSSLLAAGVAFEDLVRLSWAGAPTNTGDPAERTGSAVRGALRSMAHRWPDMTTRDAVGWMLWSWPRCGRTGQVTSIDVADWVDAGVPRDGWVYAMAGLSVEEVLDGVGSQERDTVFALAALRGAIVPVR